ncbi:MAG: thiamine phosphate synthase [Chthoniobacterales bacterium]|nr:thiamine phosphate synthase [Chthoniobacterales bacterium]
MKALADACLYGIVDLGYVSAAAAPDAAARLIEGGVDLLQLRAKGREKSAVAALAAQIHKITSAAGLPLILNDYPDLLREVPAEGAHVGQDDMSVAEARAAAGRPVIIGKSTHSLAQARAAAEEGADYIGFGPLYATPTKPGRPAIGLGEIAAVHDALSIPIFCIGGIKNENLADIVAAGARRVVIVSGWLQADDIASSVRETRRLLQAEANKVPVAAGGGYNSS